MRRLLPLLLALPLAACGTVAAAHPADPPAATTPATEVATFTWRPSVIDERSGLQVTATLFVDGKPCGGETCQVPSDAQEHRLQVRAAGYQDWELGIRAHLKPSRVLSGPVRLRATGVRGV